MRKNSNSSRAATFYKALSGWGTGGDERYVE
jgi:hypothetical protein